MDFGAVVWKQRKTVEEPLSIVEFEVELNFVVGADSVGLVD